MGTPEKPLSDLGLLTFRSYWKDVILDVLSETSGNITIREISERTALRTDDIVDTLQSLNLLRYHRGSYILHVSRSIIQDHLKNRKHDTVKVDFSRLHWSPYQPPPRKDIGK